MASAAGTVVLAAVSRGSCPTDAEWEDCSDAFSCTREESEDGLAGTEEPPGLKKQPRKLEASFCLWIPGAVFGICASFWVKGGNGIWVDISKVSNMERIRMGSTKNRKKVIEHPVKQKCIQGDE